MLSRNMQLFLFSTTLLTAGAAHASPVLYAWGGHSDGTSGGRTYAIDPVAATVIVVRGPSGTDGGGSGAGGSGAGGTASTGTGGAGGAGGSSSGGSGRGAFSFSNLSGLAGGGSSLSTLSNFNVPDDCGSLERLQTLAGMLGVAAKIYPAGSPVPCSETLRSTLLELVSATSGSGENVPPSNSMQPTASDVIFSADTFIFAEPDSITPGLLPVAGGDPSSVSLLATPAAVPEPTALGLVGLGLAALGTRMRRRKQ